MDNFFFGYSVKITQQVVVTLMNILIMCFLHAIITSVSSLNTNLIASYAVLCIFAGISCGIRWDKDHERETIYQIRNIKPINPW